MKSLTAISAGLCRPGFRPVFSSVWTSSDIFVKKKIWGGKGQSER